MGGGAGAGAGGMGGMDPAMMQAMMGGGAGMGGGAPADARPPREKYAEQLA
jgi:ubiquilin